MERKDLIDIIQKNEQKSKYRLVTWILVCLTLAMITLYFGYVAQNQAKRLKHAAILLEMKSDSLMHQNAALEASRHELDSVKGLLQQYLTQAVEQLQETSLKAEIQKELQVSEKTGYIIYLHSAPGKSQKVTEQMMTTLRKNGFSPKGVELVNRNFDNRIKYFHAQDREAADRVYRSCGEAFKQLNVEYPKKEFSPQKYDLKAPMKQIEVWVNLDYNPGQDLRRQEESLQNLQKIKGK